MAMAVPGDTSGKRILDAEEALIWAADELAKLRDDVYRLPGWPSHLPMFRETVTPGRSPPPAGEPHPDALAIQEAVSRLEVSAEIHPTLKLGIEMMPESAASAMTGAAAKARDLVWICAWKRKRPPLSEYDDENDLWMLPKPHRAVGPNGKVRVLAPSVVRLYGPSRRDARQEQWTESRLLPDEPKRLAKRVTAIRAGLYPEGAFCELIWSPRPGDMLEERAKWIAWRRAMDVLAAEFADTLPSIAVTPLEAPMAPWENHWARSRMFARQRDLPYQVETRAEATARRLAGERRPRPKHGPVRTPPRVVFDQYRKAPKR